MKILPLIIGLGALYAITKSDTKKTTSSTSKSVMQQALEQNGFYYTDKILVHDLKNKNVVVNFHDFAAKIIKSEPAFLQMPLSADNFNENVENYLAQFIAPLNPDVVKFLSIKSNSKTTNIILLLMIRMALNAYETEAIAIDPNIDEEMLNNIISTWEANKAYSYGITPEEVKSAVTKLENTGKYP